MWNVLELSKKTYNFYVLALSVQYIGNILYCQYYCNIEISQEICFQKTSQEIPTSLKLSAAAWHVVVPGKVSYLAAVRSKKRTVRCTPVFLVSFPDRALSTVTSISQVYFILQDKVCTNLDQEKRIDTDFPQLFQTDRYLWKQLNLVHEGVEAHRGWGGMYK